MSNVRNDALLNGALMALGAVAVIDNIVGHWILELHRVTPGPEAIYIEVVLVVLGAVLLGMGLWRERTARRGTADQ